MRKKIATIVFLLSIFTQITAFALTGEEIIQKADEMQIFNTSKASGEMRITDRFGTKVSTFNSWTKGANESLIEFTSTAERGQKILRTEEELYLYYPDAEELIRMQGSMLRQSMLGSDVSYEDMAGDKNRLSKYKVELLGEEKIKDRDCYVLMMTATVRTVPYPKEKVWIDKETFLGWKAEYYTKSGRLLKVLEVLEAKEIAGKYVGTKTKIVDKMKKDTETIMILNNLTIDIELEDDLFSLDELSW